MTAPDWRDQAACAGMDPDEVEVLFFPHPNSDAADAKAICVQCPVAEECLTYALETRQEFGVWGAMTESERYAIRPPLRANAARCGTETGYRRHRRNGEKACTACLAAKAASTRKRDREELSA